MEQLKKLLLSLTMRQRIIIAAAAVVLAGGIFAGTRWNREKNFRPLIEGAKPEDAGAVVKKLQETAVPYRLDDNGTTVTVKVPAERLAETRLQMTSAGLPKSGRIGFELFDKNNFGATDFAEHVNFRRALEGELQHSVDSLAEVQSSRVHVTFPKDSVFTESRQPAKASVMVKLKQDKTLPPASVNGIIQMVASAVEGLSPEAVTVIDDRGRVISKAKPQLTENGLEPPEVHYEYRRKIEKDLLAKVNETLEPLLGQERFRTGVSVETDLSLGEQSEETFDPNRSVMTNSQKAEDVSTSQAVAGVPGTPSNLPRSWTRPGQGNTGMTRRSENINYQSSRLVKHVKVPQGVIKRISIGVILDQNLRWEGFGPKAKRILEPPSAEKLKAIHDVVAAAAGVQIERGDSVVVESQAFDATLREPPPPAPPAPVDPKAKGQEPQSGLPAVLFQIQTVSWNLFQGFMKLPLPVRIGIGAGLLVLMLALGAFLYIRNKRRKKLTATAASQVGAAPVVGELGEPQTMTLEQQMEAQKKERERIENELVMSTAVPTGSSLKSEILARHVRNSTREAPKAAAHCLRSWINER